MAKVTRVFNYVNGRQIFTVPTGYASEVTYHCWGGGGGAGGDSNDQLGGNGSCGSYTTGQILLNPGDEVEVVVGGGGSEGRTLDSTKKIWSATISGTASNGVGPTASYGWVNDPTKAVYPEYSDPLSTRTYGSWSAFMNAWAVSNLPSNTPGTEEVTNSIYFPEAGSYTVQIAGDNSINVWFRDQAIATNVGNFKTDPVSKTISVPSAGTYELRYVLTNIAGSSGNPAGAAILITKNPLSSMGNGGVQTYPGNVSTKNVIWSTRYGTNVNVSNRVPLLYAPVVNFYQPQSSYDWGGVPDTALAFISATSNWTNDDLAKLNLSLDRVITIGYPVKITCQGNIDQVMASGYYTFAQGQTWELARYNWLGNPGANTNTVGRGTGTPANWTERQWYNDNASGRSKNKIGATWDLPVPPSNQIYIVGFADGVIYNAPSQRGSDNLTWTVTSVAGQAWAGGNGGASVKNVGNKKYNYFGGYGGQIGSGQISGGGGGGGGASLLIRRTPSAVVGLTIAGGGGGGGGAGPNQFGENASNEYQAAASYPLSIGAGSTGASSFNSGGGGGGGGGGCDGGRSGIAARDGLQSGGAGAYPGGSSVAVAELTVANADFVMIGRGGDGGNGGGGGGAGELLVGSTPLKRSQFIQVGGNGGERLEGAPSAIWWDETSYIVAGPGGRGGSPGAAFGKTGNGQNGGCVSGDTATSAYGGSGGGGGTNPNLNSASAGSAKSYNKKPSSVTSDYVSGGGGGSAGAGGGGGGAGGGGQGGNATRAGDGGNGKIVPLGQTGKTYLLGGGGGGAAPHNRPGPYIGFGSAGGGDGSTGTGPTLEFTEVKTYTTYVPRNVTMMYIQGIGAGGSGGNGGTTGAGGGGSGGYLPRTSYAVTAGQRIDVTIGKGGVSSAGGDTVIKLSAYGNIPETNIRLYGGKQGLTTPASSPSGGAGGAPGGSQGQNGNQDGNSGNGADSPYGSGGSNCEVSNSNSKPGNGNGYGAGGGGGATNRNGGLGGNGYVLIDWPSGYTVDAQANTGSGGGGGFDGGGGNGGSGFVAIAYPGEPKFTFTGNGKIIRQNGYTIHEMYSSGDLNYTITSRGYYDRGNGIYPAGTGVNGYVPGTGVGGVGQGNTNVYPVSAQAYPTFLNTYGVWNQDSLSANFDREYIVYFPESATYEFKAYADNGATVKIDGGIILDMTPANRDNGTYWWKNGQTENRKITSGLHRLTINATSLGNAGAFALTILKQGTTNPLIFNSRNPPIIEGSPTGGNGLVILEFQGGEGTATIKENNNWSKVVGQWVKVGGSWKVITDSSVKINGVWQSLFGAKPINVTINTADFGGPPTPATPTANTGVSSGGGGGGGCCVMSTAFANRGIWEEQRKDDLIVWCEKWLHNNMLGECFRRGYQVLGSINVRLMHREDWVGRIWTRYATWAFNHGTNMVRGKKFSLISVPNSIVWISAFMLVGALVTKNFANRCWKRLYKWESQ